MPEETEDGRGEPFALAPMQQGMLAHSLRRAGVEVQQVLVEAEEGFDLARLTAAWEWTVARHPALRTCFDWTSGERATQRAVAPSLVDPVCVEPLEEPFEASLEALLTHDRTRERPLDRPFGGLRLLRGADREVLLWTHHHAHIDGRSIEIVLGDLLRRYDAGEAYAPDPAPAPNEHIEALERADTEASVAHFVATLEGHDDPTPVPGRCGPLDAPAGTREHVEHVDAETVAAIRAHGEREGFTLANAVQLAWAAVLSSYGFTDDVVFGVTRSGRYASARGPEIVGCLINTIPLRVTLDAAEPCVDALRRLREAAIAARPHENAPLHRIRAAAGVPSPIFHTVVVHERHTLDEVMRARADVARSDGATGDVATGDGATGDGATGDRATARRFALRSQSEPPITLALYERADGRLQIVVEHREVAVDEAVAACLPARVADLLAQLGADPTQALSALRVTTAAEERPLKSGVPIRPAATNVVDALRPVVEANPTGTAVVEAETGRSLRFEELAGAATALAERLADAGVGVGEVVAVHAPPRLETVVALLGTQLAGAVYLPIDPSYPAERIAYLVEDSGARALAAPADASPIDGLPRVTIDLDAPPKATLGPAPDADVAYMIYTSGSTGKPKGVRVSPTSLKAHAAAARVEYGLTHHDRVLHFASPSFDVSIEEIVPTLLVGACVVVRDAAMTRSVARLRDVVARENITVLQLPTAFFNELARERAPLPSCVRMTIIGGERASARACRAFSSQHPTQRLINAYGPTEVTITSVAHTVTRADALEGDVPIGAPFGATFARVVDAWDRPAPRGARGHLLLGGPQVALGYHARPALTAERFIPDPVEPSLGRVYRTGDLVRQDPEGCLVYEGRIDQQVKIRGYRVEIGEVEAALLADQDVAEAAVVVRRDEGAAELAAYLRPTNGRLDVAELRARLARAVPSFMVPAELVPVPSLPTTPGGKVDRRALARRPIERTSGPDVPSGPELEALRALFEEVVGRPVAPDADFFDVGGHSLRAIRLARRIRDTLGVDVGAGAIFARRTPRALAALLEGKPGEPRCELLPLNDATSERRPLYCVLGVDLYRPIAEGLGSRKAFGVYVPEEEVVGTDKGPISTEDLAAAYIDAISRRAGSPPELVCGFSYGGIVALEMAQQLRAAGTPLELLVLLDPILPGMDERKGRDVVVNFLHRLRYQTDELPTRIGRRIRAALGDPPIEEVPTVEREAWLEREAAYTEALYDYVPRMKPYDGRSILFVARDRLPAALRSSIKRWQGILGPFAHVEVLPGDHGDLMRAPHAREVARTLRKILRRRASVMFRP